MNKKKKLDQNTIQTAKRLLKYMTGTHKIQFIIVFICIFISSAASIAVSLSLTSAGSVSHYLADRTDRSELCRTL